MPLWSDIHDEINKDVIPEEFSAADLRTQPVEGGFLVNGTVYSQKSLNSILANYCLEPPGNAVLNGQTPRFFRLARGQYRLTEPHEIDNSPDPTEFPRESTVSSVETRTEAEEGRETRTSFILESGSFVDWFTGSLNEFDSFQHSWRTRSSREKSGFPDKTIWSCTSLYSAYQQYIWPSDVTSDIDIFNRSIKYLPETSEYLNNLKQALNQAIEDEDGALLREVCNVVLKWGASLQKMRLQQK